MAKGKNARKRANRLAAIQSTSNITSVNDNRSTVDRAVEMASNREPSLVYIHAGNKYRARTGEDRRFQSRKPFKRQFCRTLDFAKYPVTGLPSVLVNYRLIETNNKYKECHEIEHREELSYLTRLLKAKLDKKPVQFQKTYVRDKDTGKRNLIFKDNSDLLFAWEREVKAIRARIQDMPRITVLSKPDTMTEVQLDGTVKEVQKVKVMEPNAHPANARLQRPAWNKDEVITPIDMTGVKSTVFSPLRKMANSHRKEIPLSLALWMICQQEGLDAFKLYGVTDNDANEMLEKLHERN